MTEMNEALCNTALCNFSQLALGCLRLHSVQKVEGLTQCQFCQMLAWYAVLQPICIVSTAFYQAQHVLAAS